MKMTLAIVLVELLGACSSDDRGMDSGGGPSSLDHPRWLVGGWDHDEGREGYADYADYAVDFDADGTYVWTYAVTLLDGEWRYTAGRLVLGSEYHDLDTSKACRVIDLEGKWYLNRASDVTGCPTSPAALSSIEKCVVGTFTSSTPNGGEFKLVFDADRTMVEHYDDPGYTSGGSSYTRAGEWKLLANGDIEMAMPGADAEVRASVEGIIGMRRAGSITSGCDMTGFQKLGGDDGGGSTCTTTCDTGKVCAEYGSYETCCGSTYPHWCPDLHACFTTAAERDAECATSSYGDPSYSCGPDQSAKTFQGLSGTYCAPSCAGGATCPMAVNGKLGTCASEGYCYLSCTDVGVTAGQCPHSMTCTPYGTGTSGLCLFQ